MSPTKHSDSEGEYLSLFYGRKILWTKLFIFGVSWCSMWVFRCLSRAKVGNKMRRFGFPWKMDGYLSSPLISVLERWIGTNNSPTHLCYSKLWFLGCRNLPNRCKKLHPCIPQKNIPSHIPQFVSLSYHAGLLWLLLTSRVSESSLNKMALVIFIISC